ncbi:ATP-binding protein [Confluentibacter citreus]|uniref:ATP-binding protein n=1 Tax=Confluentibacter citreus TaxID=2007307 RepID=UPI000C292357|nr:ATP-binding protein [Confluentibacter citreus]
MEFKRVYTSSQTYVILLIIAIALLLFTTSMAYRQIMLTQKSAEMVVNTLQVYNTIGDLTNHYSKAESNEFREELLNNTSSNKVFETYKSHGIKILDTLKLLSEDNDLHKARLKPLQGLLDTMYDQLLDLNSVNYQDFQEGLQEYELRKLKIKKTISSIRSLINRMLADEERLMNSRKAEYSFHKSLTPTMLLVMAFCALTVFVISFFRIYNNKLKIRKSEAFLKSVLATTDNIVTYYEPIYINNDLIDFKIVYANDCVRDYLNLEPDDIKDKTVSSVHPFHKSKGELEELIQSYKERSKIIFDRQIIVDNKKMWFHSVVMPLDEGLLVTSRNSTAEEEAKEVELLFKKQLENQNIELLDNRAFLTNIFKSILHLVMHFKSIRGEDGNIIDFEILFINDRVNKIIPGLPEDIKNKKISEVYPDIFKSEVFAHLVNAVESDKPGRYEISYHNNGAIKWYRYTAIKLGDGVTVTTRDITEEKEKANEVIKLNEELIIQNSILRDAERIAKTGSFLWHLVNDVSEFSDNFYRMLDYEPREIKLTYEKYREFIHEQDREDYDNNITKAINELHVKEHIFRIITKHGLVKHFKTTVQFVTKDVVMGVVQDVSLAIDAEEKLLKSNIELKNSNAELESFNRVASHDLQEPLRKIQLFVQRINDTENDNLSTKSQEYFSKVINAVNRMQSLIQNLLAYSRIDSSKRDFEEVDLNQVLDKIKEDLATSINDSNAEIISVRLPKINGVLFQMEQLFTNLLSNALKYRSINETPIIQIRCEKIPASQISEHVEKSIMQYYKISFIDNGIGFDSQHTSKIFEVFQRLHQKTEYTGNGIGLAICKKIVENHNGHLYAKGSVGIGAEFIIYLPV